MISKNNVCLAPAEVVADVVLGGVEDNAAVEDGRALEALGGNSIG